jgi:hypothetical protein
MVPILSGKLEYRKDLLYNGAKMPNHPVATLRLENKTGLTLERGPLTVLENGEYVGEAVLPFTANTAELAVPYAVELGIKFSEHADSRRELHSLHVKNAYLHFEHWDIRWREYQAVNSTEQPVTVLIEHPRSQRYDLFDTLSPRETTSDYVRFELEVAPHKEETLRVQERRLISKREALRKQSAKGLRDYLKKGLLEQETHDRLAGILTIWEQIDDKEQALAECDKERQKVYKAQQQIQGNMKALKTEGKEGALRTRYVEQLEISEEQLRALVLQEKALKKEIEALKVDVKKRLKT